MALDNLALGLALIGIFIGGVGIGLLCTLLAVNGKLYEGEGKYVAILTGTGAILIALATILSH